MVILVTDVVVDIDSGDFKIKVFKGLFGQRFKGWPIQLFIGQSTSARLLLKGPIIQPFQ